MFGLLWRFGKHRAMGHPQGLKKNDETSCEMMDLVNMVPKGNYGNLRWATPQKIQYIRKWYGGTRLCTIYLPYKHETFMEFGSMVSKTQPHYISLGECTPCDASWFLGATSATARCHNSGGSARVTRLPGRFRLRLRGLAWLG